MDTWEIFYPKLKTLDYEHGMIICDIFFPKENWFDMGSYMQNKVENLHLLECEAVWLG